MSRRLVRLWVLTACALSAALPLAPSAPARGSADPVISDCVAHAALTGHYSVAQLRHALSIMSAETKEYTSCPDVINRAILAALGKGNGGGGTGGGSGSFLPTPVIVILVILILVAVIFGAMALRRRRDPESDLGRGAGGPGQDRAGGPPEPPVSS